MKVLIVQNTDYVKRYPAQQHHIAEILSLRGHEVRIIDFEILWRDEKGKGLISGRKVIENFSKAYDNAKVKVIHPEIIRIPLLDYVSLMFYQKKEIERQIIEFSPDVIYSMGIVAYLAGNAAQKHNIPFIYYWIDVTHRLIPFKFLHPLGRFIERLNIKKADKILAINEGLRDYVIKQGANPDLIEVLGAGIDIEKFDPLLKVDDVRNHYGIQDDDIVLFFMGFLYDFSGLKEVSKALKYYSKKFKLLIVGNGDAYNDLQRIRKENELEDRIILTGRVDYNEIPLYISAADICILPAYNNDIMESIVPIKMYEYMAMGKPVITTMLPGVMKEFGHENGVIYVDKPEKVLKKAEELKNEDRLIKEGNKARKFAKKRDWQVIVDKFESIVKEIS